MANQNPSPSPLLQPQETLHIQAEKHEKSKFEPKTPVNLAPPKDDPISSAKLKKCNGIDADQVYVAIKGIVFDVTGNKAYERGGAYHVFAGNEASRALALTSTKAEDVRPDWQDLDEKEKGTLADWVTFFEKRYNIVGRVVD